MAQVRSIWRFLIGWFAFLVNNNSAITSSPPSPIGYLVYCPCMGRFGNQADHFLGSLAFAKALNRTLILPPWVEYEYRVHGSKQIPFDRYFSVDALAAYHPVITMEQFMTSLAPVIWPPEKRIVFCYGPRPGEEKKGCNAKDGNPFGPFWDYSNVDFPISEFIGDRHLSYSTEPNNIRAWLTAYPAYKYPVLAFPGAPASFPVAKEHRWLQQYLEFSDSVAEKAVKFRKDTLLPGPYLAIHLRNDMDWPNVCEHVAPTFHLFASPQCVGYGFENGKLSREICMPTKAEVLSQIKDFVRDHPDIQSIFVSADRDHMIDSINGALESIGRDKVRAFRRNPDDAPHVNLALMAHADYFIGNCISSFTAFAVRSRDSNGRVSAFWGWENPEKGSTRSTGRHVEL